MESTSESEDAGNTTPTPSSHDGDDDDEEEEEEEEEEEYTPVPKRTSLKRASMNSRASRLQPSEESTPSTARPARKSRRSMSGEPVQTSPGSDSNEDAESMATAEEVDPQSPSQKAAAASLKRKSMAPRKSHPEQSSQSLPTPESSASP